MAANERQAQISQAQSLKLKASFGTLARRKAGVLYVHRFQKSRMCRTANLFDPGSVCQLGKSHEILFCKRVRVLHQNGKLLFISRKKAQPLFGYVGSIDDDEVEAAIDEKLHKFGVFGTFQMNFEFEHPKRKETRFFSLSWLAASLAARLFS